MFDTNKVNGQCCGCKHTFQIVMGVPARYSCPKCGYMDIVLTPAMVTKTPAVQNDVRETPPPQNTGKSKHGSSRNPRATKKR